MNMLLLTVAALLAAAVTPAVETPNVPPATASAPAAVPTAPAKPITVTANKDEKAPWNGEKIVCTRETPVGSMIPVKRCTTKSVDEQNQRAAREVLTRPIAGVGGPQ